MYITEKEIQIPNGMEYEEIILEQGDFPWEGGINGKFYRISRGKPVKVPANLAKLIRLNEQVTIVAKKAVSDYETGNGKCLGGKKK